MEPQNNTQFTGTSDNQSQPFTFAEQKGSNIWKIISIIAIVLVVGLGAGFPFFFMKSTDDANKIKTQDETISDLTKNLNAWRDAAGTQTPEELTTNKDIDFKVFYTAMSTAGITTIPNLNLVESGSSSSYIKLSTDKKYQIASFAATDEGGGWGAFFYRTLPDGDWKYSNFSGQAVPSCDKVTDAEIAAFDGIISCEEVATAD